MTDEYKRLRNLEAEMRCGNLEVEWFSATEADDIDILHELPPVLDAYVEAVEALQGSPCLVMAEGENCFDYSTEKMELWCLRCSALARAKELGVD